MSEIDLGTNTPAVSESTAPTQPAATSQEAPPVATTQATSPASANDAPPATEPSWLKRRLDETRAAAIKQYEAQSRSQWTQKETEYQTKLQEQEARVRALVGLGPQENPEVDAIRKQFAQVFPKEYAMMQKLSDKAEQIEQLLERSGDFDGAIKHHWDSHAQQSVGRLYSLASEAMGGPLSDMGKQHLHGAFVQYVQSSPEAYQRYQTDPTLVEDFVKAFTSSFIDPVRRSAVTQTVQRAPGALPQDTPGGVPRTAPAQTFTGLDDRAKAAWTNYNQFKKQG